MLQPYLGQSFNITTLVIYMDRIMRNRSVLPRNIDEQLWGSDRFRTP